MFAAAISHEKFGALWSAVRHSVGRVCFGAEAVTYAGASLFSTSASHLPGTQHSWLTQHWHLKYEICTSLRTETGLTSTAYPASHAKCSRRMLQLLSDARCCAEHCRPAVSHSDVHDSPGDPSTTIANAGSLGVGGAAVVGFPVAWCICISMCACIMYEANHHVVGGSEGVCGAPVAEKQ